MQPSEGPWWTISERVILELLHKVHAGEHPDDVYAELYANAPHHELPDDNDR